MDSDKDKEFKPGPSGLTPSIAGGDEWSSEDISAIIAAAEDQDETLKKLNEAYNLMWFALFNYEEWDEDDDHPFHEALNFIGSWRHEKYPHIWPEPMGEE